MPDCPNSAKFKSQRDSLAERLRVAERERDEWKAAALQATAPCEPATDFEDTDSSCTVCENRDLCILLRRSQP